MLLEQSGKDYLAELYGKVIENVQKTTVSDKIKNTDLSGDPEAGSVEAKRFANATAKTYGTARANGKGDGVTVRPVTIKIDNDKEIVEELEEKDVRLYGVDGVLEKRAANHVQVMASALDTAFFAEAKSAGTQVTLQATAIEDKVEEMIQTLETVKNDFVDGVPREMMSIVCTPKVYGQLRTYLDKVTNVNIDSTVDEFVAYHGVKIFSSVHMPASTDIIVMADGAVAEPVMSHQYSAEKIPLSNAYGVELFYSYGVGAAAPDLIFYA